MPDVLFPGLQAALDVHPLFVHFPIAFWLAALAFYAVGVWRDLETARGTGRWLLYLGTGAAALAVGTGYLAANRMGHEAPAHDLVHVHRNFMLVATAIAVAASGAATLSEKRGAGVRLITLGSLLILGAIAMLGADRGARLVFGYGMGVVPEENRAALPEHHHGDEHGDHHEQGEAAEHGEHDEGEASPHHAEDGREHEGMDHHHDGDGPEGEDHGDHELPSHAAGTSGALGPATDTVDGGPRADHDAGPETDPHEITGTEEHHDHEHHDDH